MHDGGHGSPNASRGMRPAHGYKGAQHWIPENRSRSSRQRSSRRGKSPRPPNLGLATPTAIRTKEIPRLLVMRDGTQLVASRNQTNQHDFVIFWTPLLFVAPQRPHAAKHCFEQSAVASDVAACNLTLPEGRPWR